MQRLSKTILALPALMMIATPVVGQVAVTVRTDKSEYVTGEPVFVMVDVKNVGTESVGYSSCDGQVKLDVPNGQRKTEPNLWGCYVGMLSGGSGCAIDHPPMLKPGETTAFSYLLRGYRLRPGEYDLRVSGKAGVRWKYYPEYRPGGPPVPPPLHKETDPVDGQTFDRTLSLVVLPENADVLRRAFSRYTDEAQSVDLLRRIPARQAIVEMAPAFLEKTIAGFAADPAVASDAIGALGEINTAESRADLIGLFDRSSDLRLRSAVALALARTGHPDNRAFFISLLPGRDTEPDDRIREYAVLGIGRIGGDDAVSALSSATGSARLRRAITVALGNTRSRRAVAQLIGRARRSDGYVDDAVCGALVTLTHRTWCFGSADVDAMQARWRQWWESQGASIPLYGSDQCPGPDTPLPPIR